MTTALRKYAKLEAEGRYFDGRDARPREVVLGFGTRTLIICGYDDQAVSHWPLASMRALGAPGDKTIQLVPDLASDERIVLEDAEMIGAIRAVCPHLFDRPVDRRGVRRAVFWAGGAVGSALLILFVLVPALADQLADYVSPARERALGDAVARQLADLLAEEDSEAPGICIDPDGLAALIEMKRRVTDGIPTPYPLRVAVIDHEMVNAVALPGGRILLFRGLIDAAGTPEEVAGVLAHEVGHVVNRDPIRGVLRAAGTAGIIGLLLGDFVGASVIAAGTDAVLNARHRREAESLADDAAYAMLNRAKLPTTPFADFFERLRQEHGETSGPLRYVASHPDLGSRAARAAAADSVGAGPFVPVLPDRTWIALQNICERSGAIEDQLE